MKPPAESPAIKAPAEAYLVVFGDGSFTSFADRASADRFRKGLTSLHAEVFRYVLAEGEADG